MAADDALTAEPPALPPDLARPCPSCGALSAPGSRTCAACGVVLATFAEAAARVQAARQEQLHAAVSAFSAEAAAATERERRRSRHQLLILIGLAFGAAALLLVLLGGFAVWRHERAAAEARQLRALQAQAQDCLQRGDDACAERDFRAVLKRRPNDADAAVGLRAAQLGAARSEDAAQNFSLAESELLAVLEQSPGDPEATALLGDTYDQWSAAAAGRGDWLTVAAIEIKRVVELHGGG